MKSACLISVLLYTLDIQTTSSTNYLRDGGCASRLLGKFSVIFALRLKVILDRNYQEAKGSYEQALELLKIGKVTESKRKEIETDLSKSIKEVSMECENMPIALLAKDKYKIQNPHKQV